MKKKQSWPEDPVVREVREVRQRLWKEAGGTIKGLIQLLDREAPVQRVGPTKQSKPKKRRAARKKKYSA